VLAYTAVTMRSYLSADWTLRSGLLMIFLVGTLLVANAGGGAVNTAVAVYQPSTGIGGANETAASQVAEAEASLDAGHQPARPGATACTSCRTNRAEYPNASPYTLTGSNSLHSVRIATGPSPKASSWSQMAYDPKDGYVVLFGAGFNGYIPYDNETWEFQHGNWTELYPTVVPPARVWASMTYDAKDGYLLMFGGYGLNSSGAPWYLNDSWAFSRGNWLELTPHHSPHIRDNAGMAYDATDGYVVLFGGNYGYQVTLLSDTWKFAGGQWTRLSPSSHPGQRTGATVAYDNTTREILLFGGWGNSSLYGGRTGLLNGTWAFSRGNWAQEIPKVSPPAREFASMAFDAADGYLVLYGGYGGKIHGSTVAMLNDTWKFVKGNWAQISRDHRPSPRDYALMVYDSRDGYVVLFGGQGPRTLPLGDTWEFSHGIWTRIDS
jgi:hypothetical protein